MSPRVTIAEYGAKRAKIRVFTEGELARVQWRVRGKLRTESYPNTSAGRASAKAFAKGVADARLRKDVKERLSIRELWSRFAEAEFPHLRPNSQRLYKEYFTRWEAMWGSDFVVEETTLAMMHEFRAELTGKLKLQTSTSRQNVRTVKMVYAWAEANELIERNRIHAYRFKISRDEKKSSPAEYRGDEFAKIIGKLDPKSATQWRAWVALMICGNQGVRQNAVLHLQWADIDGKRVTWQSKWDKMGRQWTQPLRTGTIAALEVAQAWRATMAYAGPWVLPAGSKKNRTEVYSPQSLWGALRDAEKRAGVEYKRQRGAHGFRRMLMGDVTAKTGNAALGLQAIGDTDMRQATSYLKVRDDQITAVFDELDNPAEEPKV